MRYGAATRGFVCLLAAAGISLAGVASAPPVAAAHAHHHLTLEQKLHRIRVCESGNNWHLVSSNHRYYGAYQFLRATWHGLGFAGRPDQAKPALQTRAAKRQHAISGWSAWANCARLEHVS
ncbi:MAG TPA: transglycosylase family protein [Mycobacteriales bacterium]|nr:transglycosylase family protein [Mycobacteriales bacterium]